MKDDGIEYIYSYDKKKIAMRIYSFTIKNDLSIYTEDGLLGDFLKTIRVYYKINLLKIIKK